MALTKRDDPQKAIRMPADLKMWVEECAARNGRSHTAEIVFRLQESRRREEEEKAKMRAS